MLLLTPEQTVEFLCILSTSPLGKDETNLSRSRVSTNDEDRGVNLCSYISIADREDEFNSMCNSLSSTLLLTPTDGALQYTGEEHE